MMSELDAGVDESDLPRALLKKSPVHKIGWSALVQLETRSSGCCASHVVDSGNPSKTWTTNRKGLAIFVLALPSCPLPLSLQTILLFGVNFCECAMCRGHCGIQLLLVDFPPKFLSHLFVYAICLNFCVLHFLFLVSETCPSVLAAHTNPVYFTLNGPSGHQRVGW